MDYREELHIRYEGQRFFPPSSQTCSSDVSPKDINIAEGPPTMHIPMPLCPSFAGTLFSLLSSLTRPLPPHPHSAASLFLSAIEIGCYVHCLVTPPLSAAFPVSFAPP